jgi:hypothetical protein
MTKTTKAILISGSIAIVVSIGFALRTVRAQMTETLPFTADVTTTSVAGAGHGSFIPSMPNNTLPVSDVRHFAYNSLGDMVSLYNWPIGDKPIRSISYHDGRWLLIDSVNRLTVHLQTKHRDNTFQNPPTLGPLCTGPWDGQISGYDVVYSEYPTQVANSTEQITNKLWTAPKLGCFTLKTQRIDIHEGQLMYDITTLVHNIKVGEPDGAYFETESAANYTEVTHEHWAELAAPMFAAVAGQ